MIPRLVHKNHGTVYDELWTTIVKKKQDIVYTGQRGYYPQSSRNF